ncbi:hypothetical protein FHR81_002402 [Actinoalloteichus hoggarensis]|uniref:Uncharacterized protein n=1 Tax=Actinoalloteichus hoggarensis TaxID=1470176 RepID=A0A221W6P6_9PSEU|nr:hypothetical protein AHOG_19030 [Actinoalloteichus hoggarensis]MBB5921364.1 hypothetical protein [Actinoalloteichus hoggarensis]
MFWCGSRVVAGLDTSGTVATVPPRPVVLCQQEVSCPVQKSGPAVTATAHPATRGQVVALAVAIGRSETAGSPGRETTRAIGTEVGIATAAETTVIGAVTDGDSVPSTALSVLAGRMRHGASAGRVTGAVAPRLGVTALRAGTVIKAGRVATARRVVIGPVPAIRVGRVRRATIDVVARTSGAAARVTLVAGQARTTVRGSRDPSIAAGPPSVATIADAREHRGAALIAGIRAAAGRVARIDRSPGATGTVVSTATVVPVGTAAERLAGSTGRSVGTPRLAAAVDRARIARVETTPAGDGRRLVTTGPGAATSPTAVVPPTGGRVPVDIGIRVRVIRLRVVSGSGETAAVPGGPMTGVP